MVMSHAWMRTAMVVLIAVVLTGCSTGKLQRESNALRQENLELRDQLDETRSQLDDAIAFGKDMETQISDKQTKLAPPPAMAIDANRSGFAAIKGVQTTAEHGRVTVHVPGDILFDSGKVSLKGSAKRTLDQIAQVINNDYRGKITRIAGYTDTDPIRKSRWSDNLELSSQRAMAVHRYLQKRGVDPEQMSAAGYGQWHSRGSKAASRRVEIIVELQ